MTAWFRGNKQSRELLHEGVELRVWYAVFGVMPSLFDSEFLDLVANFLHYFLAEWLSAVVAIVSWSLDLAQLAFKNSVELHETSETLTVFLRNPV